MMAVDHKYLDTRHWDEVGFLIFSTLDAAVDVEVRGSPNPDFSPELVLPAQGASSNPFTLSAGDGTVGNQVTEYQVLNQPLPFLRTAVSAQSAPTVGEFDMVAILQT